ncbi:hypothetical protein LguiB_014152 [Lonicera macranthoides]
MGHSRHLWRWTKGSHPTPAVDLPAKIPLGHLPRTKIFNLGGHTFARKMHWLVLRSDPKLIDVFNIFNCIDASTNLKNTYLLYPVMLFKTSNLRSRYAKACTTHDVSCHDKNCLPRHMMYRAMTKIVSHDTSCVVAGVLLCPDTSCVGRAKKLSGWKRANIVLHVLQSRRRREGGGSEGVINGFAIIFFDAMKTNNFNLAYLN